MEKQNLVNLHKEYAKSINADDDLDNWLSFKDFEFSIFDDYYKHFLTVNDVKEIIDCCPEESKNHLKYSFEVAFNILMFRYIDDEIILEPIERFSNLYEELYGENLILEYITDDREF